VVFSPGEEPPPFDPVHAPVLPAATWPPARLAKAARNYAMDYVANLLPTLAERLGPAEAAHLGRLTGRLVGMSYGAAVTRLAGLGHPDPQWPGPGPVGTARVMVALAEAMDDEVGLDVAPDGSVEVRQTTWRLMRDVPRPWSPACFEAWNGLWEGMAEVHDRFTRLTVTERLDEGDGSFTWWIRPRPRRM
jgi:pimeloyl-ACP methyl ester carboxylesterase